MHEETPGRVSGNVPGAGAQRRSERKRVIQPHHSFILFYMTRDRFCDVLLWRVQEGYRVGKETNE